MTALPIAMRDVRLTHVGRTILDIRSWQVEPGSLVGVIGPNGAGKTTLLEVAMGLQTPHHGQVHLLGKDLGNASSWQRTELRRRLGVVMQHMSATYELPMTAGEVVLTARTGQRGLFRQLGEDDVAAARQAMATLGIEALWQRTYRSLSGGEQRKVLIARALAQQGELLLLDEPAANLDMHYKQVLTDLVDRIYQQLGVTTVLICHETYLLPRHCTSVLVLGRGCVAGNGPPEQVLTPEVLTRAYETDITVRRVGDKYFTEPAAV